MTILENFLLLLPLKSNKFRGGGISCMKKKFVLQKSLVLVPRTQPEVPTFLAIFSKINTPPPPTLDQYEFKLKVEFKDNNMCILDSFMAFDRFVKIFKMEHFWISAFFITKTFYEPLFILNYL